MKKLIIVGIILFLLSGCSKKDQNKSVIQQRYSFELGINCTELPWKQVKNIEGSLVNATIEEQLKIIDNIRNQGCGSIRLTLSKKNLMNDVATHILHANGLSMKVLICLKLGDDESLYPKDVKMRTGDEVFWSVYPHSKIDTSLFRQSMTEVFNDWEAKGCKIDVIEVGNEIGWCDFNGDLPLRGKNQGLVYDDTYDWNTLPNNIAVGIRKSAEATVITKELVEQIFVSQRPKVIVGGLNYELDNKWMMEQGGTILKPELILQIFKGTFPNQPVDCKTDLLSKLDGVGVHIYPDCTYDDDEQKMRKDAVNYISEWMKSVAAETALPLYVTEMGYNGDLFALGEDYKRLALFRAFFAGMESTRSKYDWKQLHVFSWDQTQFAVTKEGVLSETAKDIFR